MNSGALEGTAPICSYNCNVSFVIHQTQITVKHLDRPPKVSIVVITYQHVDYIRQCLDGILTQRTDYQIQILIGDDGSTDGTRELCIRYAQDHPDVITLYLREQSARNPAHPPGRENLLALLTAAEGKYIARCDGDDYWMDPFKLQKQVNFLENHPSYSLCFHRAFLLKQNQQEPFHLPRSVDLEHVRFDDLLEHGNFIATGSTVFRNVLLPYPTWIWKAPYADLGSYLLLSMKGRIMCLNEFMSVYRIHDKGIWSGLKRKEQLIKELKFCQLISALLTEPQKAILRRKRDTLMDALAHLRYPVNPRRKFIYKFYLKVYNWFLDVRRLPA